MVVVGRLDQKMPGPIFCPSPALVVDNRGAVKSNILTSTGINQIIYFDLFI